MGLKSKYVPAVLALLFASHAFAQQRNYRALVIGNEKYGNKPLPWAVTGAHSVADRLQRLQFEISPHENARKREFDDSVANFCKEIAPGDVVVFYYAGRVTAAGDAASLVPVDDTDPAHDLSIDLRGVLHALDRAHPAAVLVLLDVVAERPVFGFDIGAEWLKVLPGPPPDVVILAAARGGLSPRNLTASLLDALRQPKLLLTDLVRQVNQGLGAPRKFGLPGLETVHRDRTLGKAPAGIALTQGDPGMRAAAQPAHTSQEQPPDTPARPPADPPAAHVGVPAQPPPRPPRPAKSPALVRFPTMDAPASVATGARFSVLVSLTIDKLTPEVSVGKVGKGVEKMSDGALGLNLPCEPKCELEVVLAAPGFDFPSGSNRATIEMTADSDSTPARFDLTALAAGEGRLEATFWHHGAFLARVVRPIQVTAFGARPATRGLATPAPVVRANEPAPVSQPAVAAAAALPLALAAPDLTIRWEEATFGAQQHCLVMVSSPHLGPVRSAPCVPGADLARYLGERYQQLHELTGRGIQLPGTQSNAGERSKLVADHLMGLGRELYEHFATKAFQDAFWALVDKQRADPNFHFRTIQVYTNNPVLPWELLAPVRPDGSDARGFLGVDFEIARWHIGDRISDLPAIELPLHRVVAFAPHYQGAAFLAHQKEELLSISSLPGYELGAGSTDAMLKMLDDPPEGIIHFAGHGFARPAGAGVFDYGLQFEDAALNPTIWRGHPHPTTRNHPLFVLNACDTGEAQSVAGFIDGWASVLLETGASGFIGGLWPLADRGAAEFAKQFYDGLQRNLAEEKAASVAGLLRSIRAEFAKTSDPTFLAYVFYGDARLEIVP